MMVLPDILDATDSCRVKVFGLLDISRVFDTADQCLETSFGFSDLMLNWIRLFLTGIIAVVSGMQL